MQELIDGIRRFQATYFPANRELFEQLASGQKPNTLMIGCSDSRVDPNLVTQTKPGELFVLRNAGNIVPPYESAVGGAEAATIEYAVAVLKVKEIIIVGHSQCGAMGGLLQPDQLQSLPAVQAWLAHAAKTSELLAQRHADLQDPKDRLRRTVELNVTVQLDNLRTHPVVANAVERGDLELYGWTYEFETGQVLAASAPDDQFLPVA